MLKTLQFFVCLLICCSVRAQTSYKQYFDGADTSKNSAIFVVRDTGTTNIWQIGRPQKIIFDSAATLPNALITDTINSYPPSNVSKFKFRIDNQFGTAAIIAIRWKQKLDMRKKHSGGIIEYTLDSGKTWKNVFHDPKVYNFYGFDTTVSTGKNNRDTLNGIYTLSGTDTTWKDIWLCFSGSTLAFNDSFSVRFTFTSDTSTSVGEGWMIDNMMVNKTYFHTVVKNAEEANAIKVYPTVTKDYVYIAVAKTKDQQLIKGVSLFNSEGKPIYKYAPDDTRYFIDCRTFPSGMYYLKVSTTNAIKTFPVVLEK